MNNTKKISLVIVLALIAGSIWYLESGKVHQVQNESVGQALNVDATTTMDTGAIVGVSSTVLSTPARHSSMLSGAIAQIAAADRKAGDQPAIEIVGPTGFINAPANFKLSSLIGNKVILLDFWTYSCINCVRTIPYLNAWYQKYKDQGLVVVGIHTPEFDFEKKLANVQAAVAQYGIQYPVILDSNQGTWDAYNNLYWPHEYLIDLAGYIVHDHVGEGSYAETEADIQKLLAQRASVLGTTSSGITTSIVNIQAPDLTEIGSPETYFGAARNSLFANGTYFVNGEQTLALPSTIDGNKFYLGGTWDFQDQYARNIGSGAQVEYEYNAKNVYMVAAGTTNGVSVEVLQDGRPITVANAGSDVHDDKMIVTGNRLYNIVNNATPGVHTLEFIIDAPGLQIFTLTFG